MNRFSILLVLAVIFVFGVLKSADVILSLDNGTAATGGYSTVWMMEETKLLMPKGPCTVKEIQIYCTGTSSHKDTIYIVGDPAAGSISPTFWCLSYNMKHSPIVFDYPGKPGWYKFPVTDLHMDGLDRLVIQHRVQPNGPWFAYDTDGLTGPQSSSFLMNPFQTNSLGGPGQFYLANADLMVRALVEYDFPDGSGSMPPPPPAMFDVTVSAGLLDGNGNMIKYNEVSIQDINGDGWDDIIIGSNLFINQKNGQFKPDNSIAGFASAYTSWADYDNDGDLDFYSLRNGSYDASINMVQSRDRIIRNLGNMQWQEIPPSSTFNLPYPSPGKDFQLQNQYDQDSIFNPYSCITSLWVDYNQDGLLDLFLANNRIGFTDNGQSQERYFPDQLWKQQQNGTFVNATQSSGIAAGEPFSKPNNTWYGYYDCYGANAVDYNNDGRQDVFVANYRLVKDNLFMNNGDGSLSEVAATTGVQGVPTESSNYFGHGMGAEWADYNNDGYMDLCVGNLGHPDWRGAVSNPSLIFKNEGPPSYNFTDKRQEMGLKFFEMNAGALWADFDLDGNQDLWHGQISYVDVDATNPMRPGLLYMNGGAPDYKLKDMTWIYGCALHGPWSAARIDYDHDGDLDIVICSRWDGVRLFRNDIEKKGDWFALRLAGSPNDMVPLNAFGTKAKVYIGNMMFTRELNSIAGTRMTQNSNELHFGIGNTAANNIDSLVLIYPNGKHHRIDNLEKNQRYIIPYMGQATVNGIPSPLLVIPENFSVNENEPISLKWMTVPSATNYLLEIYKDADLTDLTFNKILTSNEYVHSGLSINKTYYWRVRSINNQDSSNWSSVWNFTLGNLVPYPIDLLEPANMATDIVYNPVLKWNSAEYEGLFKPKTKYNIQISDMNDFSSDLIQYNDIEEIETKINDTLKSNTKYFWRVQGSNQGALGPWSIVWSFTTMEGAPTPILSSPADGETNIPNKPTLSWGKVENADYYHLQVAEDYEFENMHYESNSLTSNSARVFKNFKPSGLYYWRVSAFIEGYAGDWSDIWSFRIEEPNSVEAYLNRTATIEINPSPVNNNAELKLTVHKNIYAKLEVYDALGKHVQTVDEKQFEAGNYSYSLNTSDFIQGIYYVKFVLNEGIINTRFVVVR